MADSSYLKKTVEPFVVDWVSNRIGIPLSPGKVPIGQRTDGTVAHFEFDGVSQDNRVALLVSTSHTLKPGGCRKLHTDASILLQGPFERRTMAFVREDVRQNFLNKCDGLLPLGKIEMVVCDAMPPEMLDAIARFQAEAKFEVGDKGRPWKPGRPRQ